MWQDRRMSVSDRLEAENLLLRSALRACVQAMRKSLDKGYTDNIGDDGDATWWYGALEKADAALALSGGKGRFDPDTAARTGWWLELNQAQGSKT